MGMELIQGEPLATGLPAPTHVAVAIADVFESHSASATEICPSDVGCTCPCGAVDAVFVASGQAGSTVSSRIAAVV